MFPSDMEIDSRDRNEAMNGFKDIQQENKDDKDLLWKQ